MKLASGRIETNGRVGGGKLKTDRSMMLKFSSYVSVVPSPVVKIMVKPSKVSFGYPD